MSFSPTDIPNCVLFLAADDISGLDDGDPVQTWSDGSGNGNDAVQATLSYRPLYKTNILNGLPCLLFDGSNDKMLTDDSVTIRTLFVVGKYSGATFSDYNGMVTQLKSVGADTLWFIGVPSEDYWYTSSTHKTRYKDGVETYDDVTNAFHRFRAVDTIAAQTYRVVLGDDRDYGRFWNGYIGEVIAYSSTLTSEQIGQVEDYLSTKWFSITHIEDACLDLSVHGWKLEDFQSFLRAHNGVELHDLETVLEAFGLGKEDFSADLSALLQSTDDLGTSFETWATRYIDLAGVFDAKGQKVENLPSQFWTAKARCRDLASYLAATDGVVAQSLAACLAASDGLSMRDFGLYLKAIRSVPAFRTITAQRVSSVVHEVS